MFTPTMGPRAPRMPPAGPCGKAWLTVTRVAGPGVRQKVRSVIRNSRMVSSAINIGPDFPDELYKLYSVREEVRWSPIAVRKTPFRVRGLPFEENFSP